MIYLNFLDCIVGVKTLSRTKKNTSKEANNKYFEENNKSELVFYKDTVRICTLYNGNTKIFTT